MRTAPSSGPSGLPFFHRAALASACASAAFSSTRHMAFSAWSCLAICARQAFATSTGEILFRAKPLESFAALNQFNSLIVHSCKEPT
jgi:hypothetical protein